MNLVQQRGDADVRDQKRFGWNLKRWIAAVAARVREALPLRPPPDIIAEASEESFPASDAPSWTPTTAHLGPSDRGGPTSS